MTFSTLFSDFVSAVTFTNEVHAEEAAAEEQEEEVEAVEETPEPQEEEEEEEEPEDIMPRLLEGRFCLCFSFGGNGSGRILAIVVWISGSWNSEVGKLEMCDPDRIGAAESSDLGFCLGIGRGRPELESQLHRTLD